MSYDLLKKWRRAFLHQVHEIEKGIRQEAEKIRKYSEAPAVAIVGGSTETRIPRCMTASTLHGRKTVFEFFDVNKRGYRVPRS